MLSFFKQKREENKVGRPRLADKETRKKAIISVCVALVMVFALLLTGAFKLNIINFNRLKGSLNYRCEEIPERFRLSDNNPYGFDDINFYSAVANEINGNDSSVCNTMDEEDMKQITYLATSNNSGIKSINGYHYLENLEEFNLRNNDIESLEIIGMTNLKYLYYDGNLNIKTLKLKDLPLLENLYDSKLVNLESIEIENVPKLKELKIESQKKLKSIRFVNSPSLHYCIDYEESSIERVYVDNIDYFRLGDYHQENMYKNLKSFKAYNVNNLRGTGQLGRSLLDELEVKNSVLEENIDLNTTGLSLKNIDISSLGNMLGGLSISDINQDTINLSTNTNLEFLYLKDGNLKELNLSANINLVFLLIMNNKIDSIDLSNQENLYVLYLKHNPIENDIYLQKGKTFNYDNLIKLNSKYDITFEIEENSIGKVEDKIFTALNEGETKVKLSNEEIFGLSDDHANCIGNYSCTESDEETGYLSYFFENKIKVYDVTSKEYKVDNNSKTIDLKNKELDIEKIVVTEGYIKEIKDNVLTIKDGNTLVDTYTLVNVKVETPEEPNIPVTEVKENAVTTTTSKKNITTKKKATKKVSSKRITDKSNQTTTTKHNLPEGDLIVYGNYIPDTMLEQIKGEDRNLTLINEEVSIIINGKDIEEVKDINIDYKLTKYEDNEEIKNAYILEFINKKDLPKKFKITIKVTEEFKKVVGLKNIDIYDYSDNKLSLIGENKDVVEDKISFYTNKLDKYILKTNKVKQEKQETKKCNLNIWLIIILLLILLIIGYLVCKKNKDKNN